MANLSGKKVAVVATDFDEEVVKDGNLITSRNPDDIPAFNRTLIAVLGA